MRTVFTEEEIKAFILKEKDLIVGENLLFDALHKPEHNVPANFTDGLNWMYKVGTDHGHLSGRIEILTKLLDFFELNNI